MRIESERPYFDNSSKGQPSNNELLIRAVQGLILDDLSSCQAYLQSLKANEQIPMEIRSKIDEVLLMVNQRGSIEKSETLINLLGIMKSLNTTKIDQLKIAFDDFKKIIDNVIDMLEDPNLPPDLFWRIGWGLDKLSQPSAEICSEKNRVKMAEAVQFLVHNDIPSAIAKLKEISPP